MNLILFKQTYTVYRESTGDLVFDLLSDDSESESVKDGVQGRGKIGYPPN